jgi:hypothetical protein
MYSPKVPARFIPALYRLGRARGRPMTQLVADAIERYLTDAGVLVDEAPPDPHLMEKRPCS